jgi:hypothetical protein
MPDGFPSVSMASARAQLAAWDANHSAATDRTLSIELTPRRGRRHDDGTNRAGSGSFATAGGLAILPPVRWATLIAPC